MFRISNHCWKCRLVCVLGLLNGLSVFSQQPESPLVESFGAYQRMKSETVYGLDWISVGPVVNSARVEAVQLDPSRPGTMYVAFGCGSLWKTSDNGVTWAPLFEDQPSLGIGDFALSPSNPDVIYLGTGRSLKKPRNFTIPGTGIYRSDDGGNRWRHLGLSDSWHIGEIAIHPLNPDIAVVAVLGHFWSKNANRGLYRTADGGKTWQPVLQINEQTGANDVVWARDNPDVVYASTWENFPGVSGIGSAIYRSSDAGITWQKCEQGLPAGDQIGRIGLAVSHSNSNKVYALLDNRGRIDKGAAQVFKSLDGGKNWQLTHQDELLIFSQIGWYFANIYVNPTDDNELFALGVRVAHSRNGGQSFDLLSGQVAHMVPSAASGLHLDHCEMWINPINPQHVVLGNDGGLYQSFDKGGSWMHFNNLPTGEFYDVAVSQDSPYRIFAGAQDNATVFGPPLELGPASVENWQYLWIDPWNGGDGCVTQVDPLDSNTVYFSAQEGSFNRKDMTTNRSKGIRPALPKDHSGELKFNFVAPLIISPHDSKTLYLAGNYVFKSTDRGDNWSLISPDIANSGEAQRQSTAAGAIAESPRVRGLIYAGTDKGALWVSEDDGKQWVERSNKLPMGYIRSISPSRFADSRVYMAVTGLNYDDLSTYLFCSEDRGVTWNSISANLSNEPANVIVEDPQHENLLYAGTFRGVYLSTDRGQSWSLLGRTLPACSVADIVIQERENDLIVATHGRGIYKMNLRPLHEYITSSPAAQSSDHLLSIPVAVRPYISDVRPGENFRAFEKTPITYWLNKPGNLTAALLDEKGVLVASLALPGAKGLNQFRWDLTLKTNASGQPYFINYKEHLDSGKYRLQIETGDKQTMEQAFTVVDAPN